MRILLTAINAKYIHSNLAIYNLKAYSEKYRRQIELAEYTINQCEADILADIYRKKPELVAISCYIWNIQMVKAIVRSLHKIMPQVPIWLGGPEVSYDAAGFLQEEECVTGILVGEGEQSFYELMQYYIDQKGNLTDIKGIVFKNWMEGEIIINPVREVMDLNLVPFAYDDLTSYAHKIIYYEASRGCPFSCSYCLSSLDKTIRFRDMRLVKKELAVFLEEKVPQVKFVDRTFNCNRKQALEIWRFIREHDNGVTNFHFEIAADLLEEEELVLLTGMRPGLIQLEIGVQSVNINTIIEIRRCMNFEKVKRVVERIRKGENIHQHLDLIAGLPHEDYESFRNSFARVYELQPDQLQLGFLKVLKGSHMYEMAEQYGIVYEEKPPYEVLYTRWISYEQILRLKAVEEMVEIHYNSGQFIHTLQYFVNQYDNPFDFYYELAQYYEKCQLSKVSVSRVKKYEILREFLLEKYSRKKLLINELLTLDLYAREKLKSRPDWAADLSGYKDLIFEFYKKEERERRYLDGYESYNYKQMSKMTHIEIFSHMGDQACLFDYRNHNPINREAKIYRITL